MKKSIFILLATTILVSCNTNKKNEKLSTIISGKIENSEETEITFYSFGLDIKNKLNVKINLNEDGSFRDTLDTGVDEGLYFLREGKNYLGVHLKEGNDIVINYNAIDFPNSVEISGKGSDVSQYLLKKRKREEALREKKIFTFNEENFMKEIGNIRESKTALLNTFSNISEDYKRMELKNIYYDYLSTFRNYIDIHTPSHKWYKEGDFVISDSLVNIFQKEFDALDKNNEEDYLFSGSYGYLIFQEINDIAKKNIAKDSTLNFQYEQLKLIGKLPKGIIRNNFFYTIFINEDLVFTDENNELYEAMVDAFSERYKDLKPPRPLPESLVKRTPSPKFFDYENLIDGGTASLDDFKGKYVYIDLWATWCSPCRAEIPFIRKLEEDYHDKNIAFVSISMDKPDKYEKLKTLVNEKKLSGTHLYANGEAYDAEFSKAYGVTYIPRFLLIDPEGNIVDADAPRPSEKRLRTLFNELF